MKSVKKYITFFRKEENKMATNKQLIAESIEFLCMQGESELAEMVVEAFHNDELLTFAEWKKKGYSVHKGEKSMFSCNLWKKVIPSKKKEAETIENEGEKKPKKKSGFVMTKCCFFLPSQVELIKKEVAS